MHLFLFFQLIPMLRAAKTLYTMDQILSSRSFQAAVAALGAGSVAFILVRRILEKNKLSLAREEWNSAGKDVVVLHQLPRATTCPSVSPFPLKVS